MFTSETKCLKFFPPFTFSLSLSPSASSLPDELLLGVTPSQRPDSPEFHRGEGFQTPPNLRSLHEEQSVEEVEEEERWGVDSVLRWSHVISFSLPLYCSFSSSSVPPSPLSPLFSLTPLSPFFLLSLRSLPFNFSAMRKIYTSHSNPMRTVYWLSCTLPPQAPMLQVLTVCTWIYNCYVYIVHVQCICTVCRERNKATYMYVALFKAEQWIIEKQYWAAFDGYLTHAR